MMQTEKDIAARLTGERLNSAWEQPVVIQNRPWKNWAGSRWR